MSWNLIHAIDNPFVRKWNLQTLRCRAVPCQESNDGGWGDPMILKARIDPNCFREHLDSAWMSTCSARWSVLTQPTDTIKIHLSWFVWSFYTKQSSSQTWLTQGNHLSSALFFSMPECQDLLGWLWNCHARSHNMFWVFFWITFMQDFFHLTTSQQQLLVLGLPTWPTLIYLDIDVYRHVKNRGTGAVTVEHAKPDNKYYNHAITLCHLHSNAVTLHELSKQCSHQHLWPNTRKSSKCSALSTTCNPFELPFFFMLKSFSPDLTLHCRGQCVGVFSWSKYWSVSHKITNMNSIFIASVLNTRQTLRKANHVLLRSSSLPSLRKRVHPFGTPRFGSHLGKWCFNGLQNGLVHRHPGQCGSCRSCSTPASFPFHFVLLCTAPPPMVTDNLCAHLFVIIMILNHSKCCELHTKLHNIMHCIVCKCLCDVTASCCTSHNLVSILRTIFRPRIKLQKLSNDSCGFANSGPLIVGPKLTPEMWTISWPHDLLWACACTSICSAALSFSTNSMDCVGLRLLTIKINMRDTIETLARTRRFLWHLNCNGQISTMCWMPGSPSNSL